MVAATKHFAFVENVMEKVHNLGADTLTLAYCNTAPTTANAILADLTQISYTFASARVITITASSQTSGTYTLVGNDHVQTATGGSVGPFRYVDFYNDTPTSPADPLICFWDYGSSITLADTETFTTDFGASILSLV